MHGAGLTEAKDKANVCTIARNRLLFQIYSIPNQGMDDNQILFRPFREPHRVVDTIVKA
jgi:hypothetical protein